MVPFLHVTTRIKDRKYDRLLSEKGFRGFPSLAFMDADGNVLASPLARTVASFEKTRGALVSHADLVKRIEGGEKGLDAQLLLAEHALGKVDAAAFKTRSAALTSTTEKQKAEIDQIIVDGEYLELINAARRSPVGEIAPKLLALYDSGKKPTPLSRAHSGLWSTVNRYAMNKRDAALAKRSAEGLKAAYAETPAAASYVKTQLENAAKLESLVALSKNTEMDAAERDVKVTMLEYELRLVAAQAFLDKASGLTAPDSLKADLEAAIVKASFEVPVMKSRTRDAATLAEAAEALMEMLDDGKKPPKDMELQVWNTIARHGMSSGDPEIMDRAADGFEATGNERVMNFVKTLRKRAEAARDETAQ